MNRRSLIAIGLGSALLREVRGAWKTDSWDTVFQTETGVGAGTVELVLRVSAGGDETPR